LVVQSWFCIDFDLCAYTSVGRSIAYYDYISS